MDWGNVQTITGLDMTLWGAAYLGYRYLRRLGRRTHPSGRMSGEIRGTNVEVQHGRGKARTTTQARAAAGERRALRSGESAGERRERALHGAVNGAARRAGTVGTGDARAARSVLEALRADPGDRAPGAHDAAGAVREAGDGRGADHAAAELREVKAEDRTATAP